MSTRPLPVWIVVLLATPAVLAILGMAFQWTIHSDWLAEVPRALGGTLMLVTGIMGCAAAVAGVWLLRKRQDPPKSVKVVLFACSCAGAIYASALLLLHFGIRGGLF